MQKRFSILFLFTLSFLITQMAWAQVLQNNSASDVAEINRGEKIDLIYQTIYMEGSEALLFDNGPLVNLPGGGCSGGDASILDGTLGLTTYGFGCQQTAGNSLADDFTSTAAWNIDSIKFFTYQTGATTVTLNGVFVQIYNDNPSSGGTVVWGDLTTNRMIRAGFTNIYRAENTTPTNCDRRVQEIVANIGTNLPAGTYWVEFTLTGTNASGPWVPPITISGQTVTGNAVQKTSTGWAAALDGTYQQGVPFMVYGTSGAPCPVQPATNPTPANNATNVSLTPGNATWTNGADATKVEFWFGPANGSMTKLYDGALVTSYAIPSPLNYMTTYKWKVVCKNDTCNGTSTTWSFTTLQNPNVLFEDNFADLSKWTAVGPLGQTNWSTQPTANAGGTAPELRMYWSPSFTGNSILRSQVINAPNSTQLFFNFKFFLDWYANPSGVLSFCATYDGGTTRDTLWKMENPTANVGPGDFQFDFISPATEAANLQLELAYDGYTFNIDNIFWDNMLLTFVVPVELTSFAATTDNNNVTLNWSTATELNNSGFQIERSNGSEYQTVVFVPGYGTTTDVHNYTYVDQNVKAGKYTYRLKQIDFDGTFVYSNVVEAEVLGIKEFALSQNYPNPFNPSTKINFSLAVDSKVSLKIFDVLGQEVAILVNGQMAAGSQEVSFNAGSLNSGVYFYRIDADGIDGQKFSSVKKMILTK